MSNTITCQMARVSASLPTFRYRRIDRPGENMDAGLAEKSWQPAA